MGDAYEYLISQFAAGSSKRTGEFYTPQQVSSILSAVVTLDSYEPATGKKKHLDSVLDFACGSGSLLLNVRRHMGPHSISRIYGQEKNVTTCKLTRMNMLLHGMKVSEFDVFHGDTLSNDWDMLRETNPDKKPVSMPWWPIRRSATVGFPTVLWAMMRGLRITALRQNPPQTLPFFCTVSII